MNGNPSLQHASAPGNNSMPGSSSYPSNPPQSGFHTSPFQFNSLPYQDTPRSSSMQQHQPGGPGQPDGMFASSFPPGADTSGVPNGSGLDYGARAHSTGMWRASSTNSGGMTLAAELLGVPLPDEYSAKVSLSIIVWVARCASLQGLSAKTWTGVLIWSIWKGAHALDPRSACEGNQGLLADTHAPSCFKIASFRIPRL